MLRGRAIGVTARPRTLRVTAGCPCCSAGRTAGLHWAPRPCTSSWSPRCTHPSCRQVPASRSRGPASRSRGPDRGSCSGRRAGRGRPRSAGLCRNERPVGSVPEELRHHDVANDHGSTLDRLSGRRQAVQFASGRRQGCAYDEQPEHGRNAVEAEQSVRGTGLGSWRLRLLLQRVEQDPALAAFGGDEWRGSEPASAERASAG